MGSGSDRREAKKRKALEKQVKRRDTTLGGKPRKQAIVVGSLDDSTDTILWSFALFDDCPHWIEGQQCVREVITYLSEFECRTWQEVEADKVHNHEVAPASLCSDAKKRLQELLLDDTDGVWSLRFKGKWRIWGIRDRRIFQALWWDPEHRVWPVDLQDRDKSSAG